jgi:quercetin dioxygenase-like cupin family protein
MKDVSESAGLSIGFISQIERGIATPSLSSLASVANMLQADVSEFLSQPRGDVPLTRHDQRQIYSVGGNSLQYERLSASLPGNILRTVLIHEPPGYRSEPISHPGEEIMFIVNGAVTVELGDQTTVLETGDSIHFLSIVTHSTWNHTKFPTVILHTGTMDVFGDRAPTGQAEASMAVTRRNRRVRTLEAPHPINGGKS